MSAPVIRIVELCKSYRFADGKRDFRQFLDVLLGRSVRHKAVLHDINLSIGKGEIVGVIGRNGAGKSTLLKALTGVIKPTSGTIEVFGQLSSILELGIGLNPELDGYQNIRFVASTRGMSNRVVEGKIPTIVEFADIGEAISHPVKTYSTGMRARLAFAIATSIEPEILVLDEVLAVGDAFFQRKCYRRISELLARDITVLLVTHDISAIRRICTRAIFLEEGRIVSDGDPLVVSRQYEALVNDPDLSADDVAIEKPQTDAAERAPQFTGKQNVFAIRSVALTDRGGREHTSLEHGQRYNLRFDLIAQEAIENASIGVSLKNPRGEAVCGQIYPSREESLRFSDGQMVTCEWVFDSSLLNGTYFVSIDVRSAGRSISLFCVEDILSFEVVGTPADRYVGVFDPNSAFTVG